MGLEPNTAIQDIKIDKVFIGSCTNGRIEDLREVAKIVKGKKVNKSVDAIVVPGSGLVKLQAEKEGLDKIFKESGFDWREPGCSMCLGMNPDQLKPKERCATNGRIEDLREVAKIVKGKKVNKSVDAIVVPGSGLVKLQAEKEGLDKIFKESGFDWREPGCSMCLGMNPDQLKPKERCASTSNRNFEGRQGRGGRTHLVSPVMAAAAAIEGKFVDIRKII